MQGSRIGLLVARAFQLIFAIVLLGVSISFVQDINEFRRTADFYDLRYNLGRIPSSAYFAAFTGAWGLLDALVGLVGAFITAIPWFVVIAFDALAAIFYIAAGINLAVLRSNDDYRCGPFCTKWTTTIAFSFLGLIITVVLVPLVFFARRK
ncbi:putative Marvel domain-containing protein [Septoria linicola]|nr:putative Marvel domain-containing protein [Septoria linicola]